VADAAGVTGRLIVDLVEGGPETKSATDLLKTGFLVWLCTIIAFAFLYWVLDGGVPESRFLAPLKFPDLAFPAQLNPGIAPPGWRPEFFDYLYLGFTDATAFSPTDVMPLARWGKLAMTVQSVCSLMILGLVIARAANILKWPRTSRDARLKPFGGLPLAVLPERFHWSFGEFEEAAALAGPSVAVRPCSLFRASSASAGLPGVLQVIT
jgi:hypothetical protein